MPQIPPKPPWIIDDVEASPEPQTDKPWLWKKGQSGNPAGKKPGTKNRKTLLREELEQHGSELAQAIKRKALDEGDSSCMSMWLARLEPPLRSTSQRVSFDFDPDTSVADQAQQVIVAVAAGDIDIDTAKELLNLLSAFVGLRDVETFLTELRRLKDAKATPRRTSETVIVQ